MDLTPLLGWMTVAGVDVAMMSALGPRVIGGQRADRFVHYAYDLGLAAAAGVAASVASTIVARMKQGRDPRRAALAVAGARLAFAVFVGTLVLREDLNGIAHRSRFLSLPLLVVLVAASIPVVAIAIEQVRARLRERLSSSALFASGLALAVTNHLVLRHDYPGIHVFFAWIAALAFTGAARATSAPAPRAGRDRVLRASRTALAVGGLASVLVPPSNGLRVDLVVASGGSLAPWMARLRTPRAAVPVAHDWFPGRSSDRPTPPSSPQVLPKDAVVVLITVDALRYDVAMGDKFASTLPTFKRLRDESVAFTDARSVAPSTAASVASFFTGKYFYQLYWSPVSPIDQTISPHADPATRLTEVLDAARVATANFTGMPGLVNHVGIVRGFTEETFVPGAPFAMSQPIADQILLRLRRHASGPLFVWAHLTDAHAPYDEGGTQGTDFERYVREVAFVDAALGRIRSELALRFPTRGALIVSADHGEAFGEHGTHYHAVSVYDELLHVPLLVRLPGGHPATVNEAVSLIDLPSTLLDLFGVASPGDFMGQSLVPFLRGEHPTLERPLVIESSRGKIGMVFDDNMKVIQDLGTGTWELYDLKTDPGETQNLADQREDVAARYEGLLLGFHARYQLHRPGYIAPFVH